MNERQQKVAREIAAGKAKARRQLAFDVGIIVTCMLLSKWWGWWSFYPLALVVGSRLHAIGEIGHMATHRGDIKMARTSFAPLGIDPDKYIGFHMSHHWYLGDPILDPEVVIQNQFRRRWVVQKWQYHIGDALGLTLNETIVVMRAMSTPRSLILQAVLLVGLIILIGSPALLLLGGLIFGLPLAHRFRAWTEHHHLTEPGVTLGWKNAKPHWLFQKWHVPHESWEHKEHHDKYPVRQPKLA